MSMSAPSLYVPLREHWKASNDVLLRELVKNGGELCSAAAAVGAQVHLQSSEATEIQLRNSRIGDAGAEAFAGLAHVTEFESSPKMTDAALVHLADMTRMTKLTLWSMRIAGDGLKHLAGMTELEQLEVCNCQIADDALSHLPTLPALSMLNLSSSTDLTSAGLECLTRLPALLSFWLNGANAVGPGLRFLAGHACLKTVDLAGGAERITTDDDLSYLPELPTVETLYLNYTHVTDRGLRYLPRLPALKTLNLEQTDVSDSGLRELAALASMKSLNLNQTLVTLRGFTELKAARPDLDVSAHNCRGEPATEVLELIQRPEMRAAAPVAESWRRIEAWFAEDLPEALDTLRPPASGEELDEFERQIGRKLPSDFRESYLIHDGQDPEAYGYGVILGIILPPIAGDDGLLDLAGRIEPEWQDGEEYDYMEDWVWFPAGAMREAWGGPGWIPFYWDCGRNYIGLDLDPGPNGFVGQVIPFGTDGDFRPVLAVSFAHLLEDVADEMESGHVVIGVPGVSHSAYWLKGVPNGYLMNSYREWAEAKLPLVFQQAKFEKPVPYVPEDHATPVSADVADAAVGVVRAFLQAMHAYEQRWLEIRPIQNYGLVSLSESRNGFGSYSWVRRRGDEKPLCHLQEVLWKEPPQYEQVREALADTFEAGKYFEQAVAEKNEIWRQHLTEEDRTFAKYFNQDYPPMYDPARLVDPDVRQVEPAHLIVAHGDPNPCASGLAGRIRWHLRLVESQWRIAGYDSLNEGKPMKRQPS